MSVRKLACWLVIACCTLAATTAAAGTQDGNKRVIVRIRSGLDGLRVIQAVCRLLGCQVERSLDTLPSGGLLQPSSLFLVELPPLLDLNALLGLAARTLGVAEVEPDLEVRIAQTASPEVDPGSAALQDYLWRRTPTDYYGTTVWEGYLEQPAVSIVRLPETRCGLGATGAGVVAVIDTGVDPNHPALARVLTEGYDFTRDTAGGDETADLGQASAAVLDGAGTCQVNQASAAVLDQASAAVLDDPDHAAFGHGTMVAGVVHLVAPTARIMPLKAFRSDGTGYTSDILRAVYYAAKKGAKVINMSFSRSTPSRELKRAIDYAALRGLIPVSSAGNEGLATLRYPAALDNVMGIASTSDEDRRSSFSNYGSRLVWVAAPGEGIVTTYPLGSYAASWGTSFSTPFVSGAAALLVQGRSTASYADSSWAVAHAKWLSYELGYGRLDLYQTVRSARLLWRLPLTWTWSAGTAEASGCEGY